MRLNITERQKEILEDVVRCYIKTASPVSSGILKNKFRFKISPATIRLDLAALTDEGFLEKHYISGGRVPTDKGYRFFVDRLLFEDEEEGSELFSGLDSFFKEARDALELCWQASRKLAEFSSNLGVSHFRGTKLFWKEGWNEIVKKPEFSNVNQLKKFTRLVNDFENKVDQINPQRNGRIKVFIGRESPLQEKEFSLVMGEGSFARKKLTFAILGPKRMDFENNISLIDYLIKEIESLE